MWYCHSNGVVHRDIKLSNLTYSTAALPGAELRLIDFGLAKQYDGTDALQERVGTPAYLAPELLGPPPLAYDSKVDLWACGVVLYQLLCGALPFEAPDGSAREQRRRIREEPLSLDGAAWADVSEAATDLVRKLLRKEADHRPPASAALEHAWLAEEAPTGQRLPRSVLRSLLAFSQASELKKLAFEAAAASAPQESLETLNRIWAGLDDGSGSLSYDRWQAHVAAHHPELTPRLAERLFAQMAGGGQRVTYHAFVNAAIMCREQSLTLPSAFALLDADGDGLVSEKDVERLVQQQESRRSGSRRSGDGGGGGGDGGGGGGSGDGGRDDPSGGGGGVGEGALRRPVGAADIRRVPHRDAAAGDGDGVDAQPAAAVGRPRARHLRPLAPQFRRPRQAVDVAGLRVDVVRRRRRRATRSRASSGGCSTRRRGGRRTSPRSRR